MGEANTKRGSINPRGLRCIMTSKKEMLHRTFLSTGSKRSYRTDQSPVAFQERASKDTTCPHKCP